MKEVAVLLAGLLLASSLPAQESTSYKQTEHTFNAGGHPSGGVVLTSSGYKITLDAVGDPVEGRSLASTSYHMDGSFVAGYPPPGEVLGLSFTDSSTLVWNPEKAVGLYNLYRGLVDGLDGTIYGSCQEQDITETTTTDEEPVPAGSAYFYLVAAENRLGEVGTIGTKSPGIERPHPGACP